MRSNFTEVPELLELNFHLCLFLKRELLIVSIEFQNIRWPLVSYFCWITIWRNWFPNRFLIFFKCRVPGDFVKQNRLMCGSRNVGPVGPHNDSQERACFGTRACLHQVPRCATGAQTMQNGNVYFQNELRLSFSDLTTSWILPPFIISPTTLLWWFSPQS